MSITTTNSRFPVQDITHHPTRFQGDNIPKESNDFQQVPTSLVPQYPTIESAIEYYESNAIGEFSHLYKVTAMWLRSMLSRKTPKVEDDNNGDSSYAEK